MLVGLGNALACLLIHEEIVEIPWAIIFSWITLNNPTRIPDLPNELSQYGSMILHYYNIVRS